MPDRHDEGVEMVRALTRWQRLGIATLFVVGVFAVGAAVFVWTGYYNISAKSQHWDITTEILETVRDQSIRARADNIPVPNLADENMIALGREHYLGGCAACHGMPGEERNAVVSSMLPDPPDLAYAFESYEASALFWLIDNGVKYTGMPAWPADGRQDEVWPMVAYLRSVQAESQPGEVIEDESPDGAPIDAYGFHVLDECARCHGDADTPPVSNLVPDLAGQSQTYLQRALIEYRKGTRASGYMIPAAGSLSDQRIAELAAYYAQIAPRSNPAPADPEAAARGAEIAANGVPEDDVPACLSCHGNGNPQFPKLAGQSQRYLENQLEVWQQGGRDDTEYGRIMAVVAERMTLEQIQDVTAFFAGLDPTAAEDAR